MRPCQRSHLIRKKIAYEASIVLATNTMKKIKNANRDQKAIDEQLKRIKCFQCLIQQLNLTLEEDRNDAKLQDPKRR